ncbi:MAG: hydrolase TatD [Gammaproteobacteria bacterium HGW-Gammaproteobacteria-14]|nr:MAG: hydrolase TatD [Gammaproteobacteria bacterium HGW-Gammaproteobacteria-14]
MPLADIGVNLTDKRFAQDRDQVLSRARDADVALQVLTGTNIDVSRDALALCSDSSDLYATVGIHPHHASDFSTTTLADIRVLATAKKTRAIGETGLDFNRDFSPRPIQEKAFAEQLALAVELELPVFLHQRDAHERFLPILQEYRDRLCNVVVHCFTGTRQELFDYLDMDCHVGITGWVCDERRGEPLQKIVNNIPLNRLLIETDSPWLVPRNMDHKPKISGRNEPCLLPWIVRQLAVSMGQTETVIGDSTWENTLRFFRIT